MKFKGERRERVANSLHFYPSMPSNINKNIDFYIGVECRFNLHLEI